MESTPDKLVLWFHHVPYTHRLKSGKSVIQHIYDTHYEGAEKAEGFAAQWRSLKGLIDEQRYREILARLDFQAGHARVWRDAICSWFHNTSGIADLKNRVGNYPDRIEAESMQLNGYRAMDVTPWENSSGGKAIECLDSQRCTAGFKFKGAAAWYGIDVEYFDQNNGVSRYRVFVNDQLIDEWQAADNLPAKKPGGDASSRRRIAAVALRPGDEIRIEGAPDGDEHAGVDFLQIF
jgi:alpha-glucuronidase